MTPRYMTEAGMNDGIARLLGALADLAPAGAPLVPVSPAFAQASPAHRALYAKYRKELKRVLADAVQWWDHRTAAFQEELGNAKQARQANWREFPAGPVSDPYTVAVLRKYWLACTGLNADAASPVAPERFLLQWVIDDGDMATAELLSAMPYWPVGLDEHGAWV